MSLTILRLSGGRKQDDEGVTDQRYDHVQTTCQ
jgi:hypothetical protein